jgi:hypothetical protein
MGNRLLAKASDLRPAAGSAPEGPYIAGKSRLICALRLSIRLSAPVQDDGLLNDRGAAGPQMGENIGRARESREKSIRTFRVIGKIC